MILQKLPCKIDPNDYVGNDGYARRFDPSINNTNSAARVVWEEANGPVPKGYQVDHIDCGNHQCIELTHLQLLTAFQNNSKGHRKLTEEQVRTILTSSDRVADLAKRFNVSEGTIYNVRKGAYYSWVS